MARHAARRACCTCAWLLVALCTDLFKPLADDASVQEYKARLDDFSASLRAQRPSPDFEVDPFRLRLALYALHAAASARQVSGGRVMETTWLRTRPRVTTVWSADLGVWVTACGKRALAFACAM